MGGWRGRLVWAAAWRVGPWGVDGGRRAWTGRNWARWCLEWSSRSSVGRSGGRKHTVRVMQEVGRGVAAFGVLLLAGAVAGRRWWVEHWAVGVASGMPCNLRLEVAVGKGG